MHASPFNLTSSLKAQCIILVNFFIDLRVSVLRLRASKLNKIGAYGLLFNVGNDLVSADEKLLLLQQKYEADEIKLAIDYVDYSLPIIELGASIGVLACCVNHFGSNPVDHVVVEASPNIIPILEENRRINKCNFDVVHAAVAYDQTIVPFYDGIGVMGGSLGLSESPAINSCHKVPSITLADLLRRSGWDRINLIVDLEGAEIELVNREIETICNHIKIMIMETHDRYLQDDSTSRMISTLTNRGFEILAHSSNESPVLVFQSLRYYSDTTN